MEARHSIYKIPPTLQLAANLPEGEREFHGNYEEMLNKFFLRSQMSTLTLLPNFQYGGWAAPSGWMATFPPGASFRQHAFCSEKYNSFIMVRLNVEGSQLTPERLRQIQEREVMCLPRRNLNPPEILPEGEKGGHGWAAALEPRGGAFIGIFKTQAKEDDEVKEIYYVVAHVLLPDSYVDAQQGREVCLQKEADEYMDSGGMQGRGCTFEKEFISDEGGQYQLRAREIGKELGKRILTDWSRIVDIKLDVMEVQPDDDTDLVFTTPKGGTPPTRQLLEEALDVWPSGGFIRPYSLIPTDVMGISGKLRGYQIGRAIAVLKEGLPEKFKEYQDKYKFRYSDEIVTFQPDCQTMINSFEVLGTNQIVWYNNCAPMDQPFLVFNGLETGFDCYNYNPLTRKPFNEENFQTINSAVNAFPVIYPYKHGQRQVSTETILKFCCPQGGGRLDPNVQPAQLRGTFTRGGAGSHQGLTPPNDKITLEPVHVFLAGGDFYNVPIYNI